MRKRRLQAAACGLQKQRPLSFLRPAVCSLQPLWLLVLPLNANASAGTTGALEMLGSLLLVLAVIFALAWLVRRLQGARLAGGGTTLQVQGGVQVGIKEKVVLIQVGSEQFLVGVAPGSVNLLHHFAEPLMPVPETASAALPPFAEKLREILGREGKA